MIEVYGKPETYTEKNEKSMASWDKCMDYCLKKKTCMLAYDNNGACEWFEYTGITKVRQTTKKEGEIVAFKVNNSTVPMCPAGSNPPTFNNQDAHGSLYFFPDEYANLQEVNYIINYSSGLWTFRYSTRNACPNDHWSYSPRAKIEWCFIPKPSDVSLSYKEAVEECRKEGGILTGASDEKEVDMILDWAPLLREWDVVPAKSYYMRIDGKRKDQCKANPKTSSCSTSEGFDFKDNDATALELYPWVSNEKAGARDKAGNDCFVVKVEEGSRNALIDVQSCSASSLLPSVSYLCGREAWVWNK